MRHITKIITLLFFVVGLKAQTDKLYLTNNKLIFCRFSHQFNNKVYYFLNDTGFIQSIEKTKVALIKTRRKIIFLSDNVTSNYKDSILKDKFHNRIFLNPIGFFFGNLQLGYQHKIFDEHVALFIPVKWNYDNTRSTLSLINRNNRGLGRFNTKNFDFTICAGLKFYLGLNKRRNFFIGPRVIYSPYLILRDWEGLGLQTSLGWDFRTRINRINHSLQFSFGFAKFVPPVNSFLPKDKNWTIYNINYYIGFGW